MVVDDPKIPPHHAFVPQLCTDGGISNKTPLKRTLKARGISELYAINTYPSYPNKTEHSITIRYPNVFSMLVRTALELLPNLYFTRGMEVFNDVNHDLRHLDRVKVRLLEAAPDEETCMKPDTIFAEEEVGFSFNEAGKHIIDPVVVAPDEELPVQDTGIRPTKAWRDL
jgi:hypothetical protein